MIQIEPCAPALHRFLDRHRVETLNIAGILENEGRVSVFVDDEKIPGGVLVKGPWFHYLHTEREAFLDAVIQRMLAEEDFYRFSGVWRPLAEKLWERFPLVWRASCDLYVLSLDHVPESPVVQQPENVRIEDAEIIDRFYTYRNEHSLEKIRTCIEKRPSSAIYVDGEIACWLLIHEDNSFGIMYTKEEHRRKGYAQDVTHDLIAKQLAAGKTPFLQIVDGNSMSPGLAQKCGFEKRGCCDWFGILVGMPQLVVDGGAESRKRVLESIGAEEDPVRNLACLCKFLYTRKLNPEEENPVAEIPAAEWLEQALRVFDGIPLASAIARLDGHIRLLGERRSGRLEAIAALVVDDDDGFELAWYSSAEPAFLQRVLDRAKTLDLGTVFVHVDNLELAVFEELGFIHVPGTSGGLAK